MERVWYEAMLTTLRDSRLESDLVNAIPHRNGQLLSRNVEKQLRELFLLNLVFEPTDEHDDLWKSHAVQAIVNELGIRSFGGAVIHHGLWHTSWEDFQRAAARCQDTYGEPLNMQTLAAHLVVNKDGKDWALWFKSQTNPKTRTDWLAEMKKQKIFLPIWTNQHGQTLSLLETLIKESADTDACRRAVQRLGAWNKEASWFRLMSACGVGKRVDVLEELYLHTKEKFVQLSQEEIKMNKDWDRRLNAWLKNSSMPKKHEENIKEVHAWIASVSMTFPGLHTFSVTHASADVVGWAAEKLVQPQDTQKTYDALLRTEDFFKRVGFDFSNWKSVLERRLLNEKATNKNINVTKSTLCDSCSKTKNELSCGFNLEK
jgi:hypothetical protein